MNDQENDEKETTDNSEQVKIQPSETETDTEENAPGRTPGKAEGSTEIIEADLEENDES